MVSTVDDEWILKWNFNIENRQGIGWHQYELPGYPASHSCLRLLENDAKWMYDWAAEWILKDTNTVIARGTPVIVYGDYDFDNRPPWFHLSKNPKATTISSQELEAHVAKHLTEIRKQQQLRNTFLLSQTNQ